MTPLPLFRSSAPYRVSSRADGSLVVTPTWPARHRLAGCPAKLKPDTDCVVCGGRHYGGVVERMSLAGEVEAVLNRAAGAQRRRLAGRRRKHG